MRFILPLFFLHVSARFTSPRESRKQYHTKKNTGKLPLCWIIREELCCFSDRFFKIHQPTCPRESTEQHYRKKKKLLQPFSFLTIVFDRSTVFQITANLRLNSETKFQPVFFKAKRFSKLRPMTPQRMSLSRDIFLSLENLNESL